MMTARVYRTIERPSRMFGLETADAFLWACSFMTLKWSVMFGAVIICGLWLMLFFLRFRKPPRFLLSYIQFYLFKMVFKNRYWAAMRENRHAPWLAFREVKND